MGISKMLRTTLYLLPLLFLYQVIYANTGARWIASDLSVITDAADSGDAYAQGFLALCHLHGDKGLPVSHLEARFYAENSASRGHWLGNFVLGYLSRFKPMGPEPSSVAKYLLESFRDPDGKLVKQAATNDPVACYVLAEIFISEEIQTIIRPDMKMAADYYELSADSNYAPACVQSALIKIHSLADSLIDDPATLQKGIGLLQKGVDQKLPAAHHYLGRCFLEGHGVKEDKELALVHFQAAADRGYGAAQVMVADFYAFGLAGEPDENLAIAYIEKAMEIHYEDAEKKLQEYRLLFDNKNDSSDQLVSREPLREMSQPDFKNKLITPSVAQLDPPNPPSKTIRLPSGYSQEENSGFDSDNNAFKNKQSELGTEKKIEVLAESSIDQIRENAKKIYWGRSSNKSMTDAFKSFENCANMGDAESARYLGIMYLRGKGVVKNANEALKWLEFAADAGDELAQKNLLTLRKIMKM